MEFDFKITTWERVEVDEEKEAEVLKAIRDGRIKSASDVYDVIDPDSIECRTLGDCGEQMTPEDNGGSATIEAFQEGETIYTNAL